MAGSMMTVISSGSKNAPTPKIKKYRTRYNRRGKYKSKKGKGILGNVNANEPFPRYRFAKLRYTEFFELAISNTNTANEQLMRLNSIFDPNASGVGHQPFGHDQYAIQFNKYLVLGVKYHITFLDSTVDGLLCGIRASPTGFSIPGKTFDVLDEKRGIKFKQLNTKTDGKGVSFKGFVSLNRVAGITKKMYWSKCDEYGAVFGYTPTVQLVMSLINIGTNATTGSHKCICRFTYYTYLFDPLTIDQS